jgi:hypothetical protein
MKVRPEHDKAGNIVRWCVDVGVAAGKRIRKRFPTKTEADLWAKENKSIKRTESVKTLSLWANLTEGERGSLMRALDILRPALTQINFEEIAQCYMTFAKPSGGKKLLTDAIQALIKRKERGNKKQSYRDRLDRDLNAFASDFPGSMVNEISQRTIEDWVFDDAWKPITQRNRLRDLHQLFAFALKEKWCGVNPVANIEKPSITWESPEVFTPQEAEWIMRTAEAHPEWDIAAPLLLRLMSRHLPSLLAARIASSGVMSLALIGSLSIVFIFLCFSGYSPLAEMTSIFSMTTASADLPWRMPDTR